MNMKLKVMVHHAEEGGYWAEVPAIPGCATEGETFEELLENLYEAIEGCLAVDDKYLAPDILSRVTELPRATRLCFTARGAAHSRARCGCYGEPSRRAGN